MLNTCECRRVSLDTASTRAELRGRVTGRMHVSKAHAPALRPKICANHERHQYSMPAEKTCFNPSRGRSKTAVIEQQLLTYDNDVLPDKSAGRHPLCDSSLPESNRFGALLAGNSSCKRQMIIIMMLESGDRG